MSKVVRFHEYGGPEQLGAESTSSMSALPAAGKCESGSKPSGLNCSEAMFRAGKYLPAPGFPSLIGYEGVGIVEALGSDVRSFSLGDRVCVIPNFHLGEYGLYAEHAIVLAHSAHCAASGSRRRGIGVDLDAVFHRARDLRRGARDGRRCHPHPRRLEQRRPRRHSARQLGRRCSDSRHPHLRQDSGSQSAHGAKYDCHGRVRSCRGGDARHWRQGVRVVFDPAGGPAVESLAAAAAEEGIIIIYGGSSGQPTPYLTGRRR